MQDASQGSIIRENVVWVFDKTGRFDLVEHWFGFMANDTAQLAERGRALAYFSHFPGSQSPQAKLDALRELLICATANVGLMEHAIDLRKQRDDPFPHLDAYARAGELAKEATQRLAEHLDLVASLVKLSRRDD